MNLNRFLLFLTNIEGLGDTTIRKLILAGVFNNFYLEKFEDILGWIKDNRTFFQRKSVVDNLTLDDLNKANLKRKMIEKSCLEKGINYISYLDSNYPKRFKEMSETKANDFPIIIYFKGDLSLIDNKKNVAIIGTRSPSLNAIKIELEITKKMTKLGYNVVSGLADGCDTIAHRTTLENNSKTIAILGTGLDIITPSSNVNLAYDIVKRNSLLISEYQPGFIGASYSYVQRDRLQAAISDIVIVIQTSSDGGTMHAAKAAAIKYNKKLLVVNPVLISDGDTSGNRLLINEFNAEVLSNLNELNIYK